MRRQRAADLTIPQFRTLAYLNRNPGTSLSDVAEFIGLTLPAMSKLTDGLVTRELLVRDASKQDRRRITLSLTPQGESLLRSAKERTQLNLAKKLETLSPSEARAVAASLRTLSALFAKDLT
jgi:DNA-binding MarR family transcriptional regulator